MRRFLRPRSIRLEAATVCQLKCPSCPTASGEIGRTLRSGFLKFENFKKIVDENPWVAEIELSNWGEILLNPDLVKIMAYAWKRSVNLRAENGVNLNTAPDEVLEGLVRYRFHSMNCSIDGASVETYPIYRRKGDFEKVILHVRKINAFKRKYGSEFPRLKWQFVAFGHNEHEIAKARQMAKELGMSFYVKLSWDGLYGESFSPVKDKETVRREVGLEAATREEYQERYHKVYIRQVCTQLWKHPQVNFDGRVLGCCVNYWADFGNAFTEGLAPSLNSEKLEYARAMLMGKKESRADIPCTACSIYKDMQAVKDWVLPQEVEGGRRRTRLLNWMEKKFVGRLKALGRRFAVANYKHSV
jgi:MoaA/NifB/PqqE/SkfB family radical SAM enzyme